MGRHRLLNDRHRAGVPRVAEWSVFQSWGRGGFGIWAGMESSKADR